MTVTNDGATILKSIYVDNAAAKRVLVDISKAQDDEVGDGTTSVVVFAGELLRQAEQLVNQKVHPMTIIQGFREALHGREGGAGRRSAIDQRRDRRGVSARICINIARTTLSLQDSHPRQGPLREARRGGRDAPQGQRVTWR